MDLIKNYFDAWAQGKALDFLVQTMHYKRQDLGKEYDFHYEEASLRFSRDYGLATLASRKF